ncbi:MAG: glycosyltransferase family 1 protein [Chloroflexi bacterium]|nr:glycosyltransferase family 1 protein [Chloroflexota bacterium]
MRVAVITETFLPDVNGVVTTLCRALEYMQRRGHEALVIAPSGAPGSYAGQQIISLPGVPLPPYPALRLTPSQPGITAPIRAFAPDVIHLAGVVALGISGRLVARRLGVPLVGAYHTNIPSYCDHYGLGALRRMAYAYLRWIHNGCQLTLCPSRATAAELRRERFRRLRLWGRGVDTERFHPRLRSSAWRQSLGIDDDTPIMLYVGRVAAEKRVDLLADLALRAPERPLVIVGDGPARPALERRLAGTRTRFTGYLRGAGLATAYASADLFIFPSDTDTFGQVVQEAMASGLPVVAAATGGAPDILRPGVDGELFAPGDAAMLWQQADGLYRDAVRRRALGAAGRRAAEGRSWDVVMDQLFGHYAAAQRRAQRWRALGHVVFRGRR